MRRIGTWVVILSAVSLTACTPAWLAQISADPAKRVEKDGKAVVVCNLRRGDLTMSVTNYGARIVSLTTPDRQGNAGDVVCGFDSVAHYLSRKQNFGAVVGRYIGRILNGRFTLDDTTYRLETGGGPHCSHGGPPGFANRVWTLKRLRSGRVVMEYVSPDGESGFPGRLTLQVIYRLTRQNALRIDYKAKTDKPTVLNPSNHSFFNLSGDLGRDILHEALWIDGDSIAEYDVKKCVTGRLIPVENTPFDFRTPEKIGTRIDEVNAQLAVTKGYDHCYQLNHPGLERPIALLTDSLSGRTMKVFTTEPAMQIYTANGHNGKLIGKEGIAYPRRNAICFETMHYPDSPNQPQFPTTVLRPGEVFRSTTVFQFGVMEE